LPINRAKYIFFTPKTEKITILVYMNLPRMKAGMSKVEQITLFNVAMAELERGFASIGRVETDLRKKLNAANGRARQ